MCKQKESCACGEQRINISGMKILLNRAVEKGAGLVHLFTLIGLLSIASSRPVFAQVQLPAVNLGDTNFEDGLAGPGWLLQEFPDGYIADKLKDARGKTVPGSNHVTAYSTTSHVAFVSKKHFLRGWIAGEVLLPLVDLEVQFANGSESRVRGIGDLIVGPGLQWDPKKIGSSVFVQRVMFDIGVPTGKYSDARLVNPGNHFVVINPYYCFTYERKKFEFSARLHYLWNSINNAPFVGLGIRDLQPGQAFHVNYATSSEIFKDIRLGFNGYWLQQVTNHQIDGRNVVNSKERTVGLGPGVQIGGGGLWFRMNSYLETDVRNRPSGIRVTLRISKVLAADRTDP
jgi:hypothetical protein